MAEAEHLSERRPSSEDPAVPMSKESATDIREDGVLVSAKAGASPTRMSEKTPWWRRARAAVGRELLVAVMLAAAAAALDLRIADRQNNLQNRQARDAKQLQVAQFEDADRRENLRFVRDRSSDRSRSRPFGGMDLRAVNLLGLDLSCL